MLKDVFCAYSDLKRIDDVVSLWRHVTPIGVDVFAPLNTAYWAEALPKLSPGDIITVSAPDHSVVYQILIRAVTEGAGYISMVARPMFPVDVSLPPVTQHLAATPRFTIAPETRPGGRFEIIDTLTGMPIDRDLTRSAANQQAELRNATAEKIARENAPADPLDRLLAEAGVELVDEVEAAPEPAVFVKPPELPKTPEELSAMLAKAEFEGAHVAQAAARRGR